MMIKLYPRLITAFRFFVSGLSSSRRRASGKARPHN